MVSRIIKERTKVGPKGESASQANLDYWTNRASENSYHGKPSRESGDSYEGAKVDSNSQGATLLPKVRRHV